MSYNLDVKVGAREMFVERQLSYEEIAAELGISASVLKQWGSKGAWVKEREEVERDVLEIRASMRRSALRAARDFEKRPPDQSFAALKLIEVAFAPSRQRPVQVDRAALFIEWLQDFVRYLKDRDGEALRHIEPHVQGFAETMKAEG